MMKRRDERDERDERDAQTERDARTVPFIPPIPLIPRAWWAAAVWIPLLLSACAKKPPADFAPDPGLVARITELRFEVPSVACPGQTIPAAYVAVLDDGSELPFATSYDEDHPPALHVVFLSRYSAEATPLGNGNWSASPDPLASAVEGFQLRVLLRARPELLADVVVAPEYSCLDHALAFTGDGGSDGGAGDPGPSVTVRMGLLSSPFVERLIVAEVTVERALSDYYVGGILLPAFVKWATGAQWELPMELPEIAEDQGRTAAPTPDEETPATNPNKSDKLAYLNQAALIFWGKADKNSRTAHPNNAAVEVWLRDKGFSVRLAQSGASIIRPEWAGTGRKPENSDAA